MSLTWISECHVEVNLDLAQDDREPDPAISNPSKQAFNSLDVSPL